MEDIIIFNLSNLEKLTNSVCDQLGIQKGRVVISEFADGEVLTQAKTSVRGKKVFIIHSTQMPVNDNIMKLLIFIDSLKRASAKEINIIMPYFGYARQDRKVQGRQPITSRLVANMLERAGVDRVVLFDIHADQIQGFFDIPVDSLRATPIVMKYILGHEKIDINNLVIVSPDYGGVKRARKFANLLNVSLAIVDKRRPAPNVAEVNGILGDVKGKVAILMDDMIDTAGTIIAAARLVKIEGAKKVFISATHPLFSGPAVQRIKTAIEDGILEEMIVTDSIDMPEEKKFAGLKIISLSNFIAEVIKSIVEARSISSIYQKYSQMWEKQ